MRALIVRQRDTELRIAAEAINGLHMLSASKQVFLLDYLYNSCA